MAKITYRSYTTPSHLYSPNSVIWKREDGRYIVAGLQSKEAAESIRKGLIEIIRDYGNATVMDLYDFVGAGRGRYELPIGAVILGIVLLACGIDSIKIGIQQLINPEYFAFKEILDVISAG